MGQLRQQTILRVENQLEKRAYPRLQMRPIVSLSGAAGLLSSATLLRLVRTEQRNWLRAVVTRTLWPLVLTYTPAVAEAAPAP